jgi:hypothetical protein
LYDSSAPVGQQTDLRIIDFARTSVDPGMDRQADDGAILGLASLIAFLGQLADESAPAARQ